jgi:peptidoglycan/xylan/chitin deacetylase (PgdA/CDA1 family)
MSPHSRKKSSSKVAHLTFDDGPSKNTEKLLAVLAQHKVRGTFFVNGREDSQSKLMYKKIKRSGHAIGNHTYSHDYSQIYKSRKAFFADFYRMERFLHRIIGIKPRLFRFPGGSNNRIGYSIGGQRTLMSIKAGLRKKNYRYFDWTIDSQDSAHSPPAPRQMINHILRMSRLQPKCIILFHEFSDNALYALPAVIRGLKRQGFRFDLLSIRSFNYQIAEGQK